MRAEIPHVADVQTQKNIVRDITDLNSYEEFNRAFFYDNRGPNWMRLLNLELSNPDYDGLPQEYFRFLGLVGITIAQFGFPHQEGQVHHHRKNRFKKSPLDPRHQLALASYMGSLNTQSYPLKDRWSDALTEEDPEAAQGVWGLELEVRNGQVLKANGARQLGWVRKDARLRTKDSRPICLPDRDLNEKLTVVHFTGRDAEEMTAGEFEEEVLPRARDAVAEYVDLQPVFHR